MNHWRWRYRASLVAVALTTPACLIEPNPKFVETASANGDTGLDGTGSECPAGTLDCDDQPGCESDSTDPLTCGSCEKRCVVKGEQLTCEAGECSGTLTFTDLADSYVDHDLPDQVFGGESELRIDSRRDAYVALPSLLEIPSTATYESIELLMSCSQAGGAIEVYRVSSPWQESDLAGSNAPSISGEALVSFNPELGENAIDLFDKVPGWRAGEPKHSLALLSNSMPGPRQPGVTFASRESGEGPRLVLTIRW